MKSESMVYFLRKAVVCICLTCVTVLGTTATAQAQFTIEFGDSGFTQMPVFNELSNFNFSIGINEPLVAGGVYSNPDLNIIDYDVFGVLAQPTPSGFPAFNLERTIVGDEFYTQGSSLNFTVQSSADLSDGLQVSELEDLGGGLVFEFNGREVDTGRYHPALVQLFSDNTGRIQNSNNLGGINPSSDEEVDVDFGDEYIVDFTFLPSLTLVAATVPEPSSIMLLAAIGFVGTARRRR